MNFAPKPREYKIDVIQILLDKLILKFLCLHSVLFWIIYLMFSSEVFI